MTNKITQAQIVMEYFKNNPILSESHHGSNPHKDFNDDEEIFYFCMEIYAGPLMGYSEYYDFRVCESATLTYLANDIIAKEI